MDFDAKSYKIICFTMVYLFFDALLKLDFESTIKKIRDLSNAFHCFLPMHPGVKFQGQLLKTVFFTMFSVCFDVLPRYDFEDI